MLAVLNSLLECLLLLMNNKNYNVSTSQMFKVVKVILELLFQHVDVKVLVGTVDG